MRCIMVSLNILSGTTVVNIDDNKNVSLAANHLLQWFLKDHVTLKTGVMMLKIQFCQHRNKLHFWNLIEISYFRLESYCFFNCAFVNKFQTFDWCFHNLVFSDEGALVKGAKGLGFVFTGRTPHSVIIEAVSVCFLAINNENSNVTQIICLVLVQTQEHVYGKVPFFKYYICNWIETFMVHILYEWKETI